MKSPLLIDNLSKYYGDSVGVEGVSLHLEPGEVFGFLGPNGAGKTTTIRTIMDFLRPSEGKVEVLGMDSVADSLAIKEQVGYLAGDIALYGDMNGQQILRYLTALGRKTDWELVTEYADLLQAQLDRPVSTLSKGNKQKIGLVQAFMHKPDLLVLDEPTSGLDPLMQQVFYEMVEEAKDAGRTVFISSHNLGEVQRLCDRAAFIREGKLIGVEKIGDAQSLRLRRYRIRFGEKPPLKELEKLKSLSDIKLDETDPRAVHVSVSGTVDELIRKLADYEVDDFTEDETTLEDVFMHYYEGKSDV